jgi:hypothetical protein
VATTDVLPDVSPFSTHFTRPMPSYHSFVQCIFVVASFHAGETL